MRTAALVVVLCQLAVAPVPAQTPPPRRGAQPDALTRARQLYNAGDLSGAIDAAMEAAKRPGLAAAAALVQGRARLERYRRSGDETDLSAARALLAALDVTALPARDRLELAVGLAQTLFLDGQYGGAAELFSTTVEGLESVDSIGYDRVIDWWAASLDRYALGRPAADRPLIYAPLVERLEADLRRRPESAPAVYWLAAAVRGSGHVDRAWNLVIAGWARAPLTGARAAALRADLDQLMTQAIIPERARRAAGAALKGAAPAVTADSLAAEWELIKERWK